MLCAPAGATTGPQVADDGDAIIVTGRVDDYRVVTTTSGTRTETEANDVPQSIGVVTAEQIDDQQLRSMIDLARVVPGMSAGQGEGHRDQVTIRGSNSTADFFVDGLRDDVQYFRSFYNLDRVEVHRGPNAMIFGRGGGGGLVNRITKAPILSLARAGLTLSADSFGAAYGAADLNQPVIADVAAIRLNGFFETLANHRDQFDGERWAVNPVAGVRIGGTTLQLGYEHVRDDRVVDRGLPSARAGTLTSPASPLAGFDSVFLGRADTNRTTLNADVVSWRSESDLGGGLRLTTQALYGDYAKAYGNIFANGPVSPTNTVALANYRDLLDRQSLIAQGNLIWTGALDGMEHTLLIGSEYTRQDSRSERINGFFDGILTTANRTRTIALSQSPAVPPVTFVAGPSVSGNRVSLGTLEQWSLFAQEQLTLSPAAEIIAGLRYDRLTIRVTDGFAGTSATRTDGLWSPRIGLVLHPADDVSVYASFARSWLPQSGDQFITLDATAATLEPERFDNIEFGIKADLTPRLNATLAVYRLDRTNTRATGPTPGSVVQSGAQRSVGAEISLTGRITDAWSIAAGYAHNRARISETTAAAPAGRLVAQVPRHQLSLWSRYDVSDTLGFGLGLSHQSAQFATISNAVRLPAYTRVDAALFWDVNERLAVQLNIENLTDEDYFPTAHNDANISPGAPINARLTVNLRF